MPKTLVHYEYLARERIRNLYQQTRRGWVRRIPVQLSFSVPQVGQITLGKPAGNEPSLTDQLDAVLARLEKHQAENIGTIDEPHMYIKGILPMFTHRLPQGFGIKATDEPEFIYYGGATETTIFGLAGPIANVVGQIPAGGSMNNVSSSLPNLTRVLAREYQVHSRFLQERHTPRKRAKYEEEEALACIWYMEQDSHVGMHLRNYAFLATLKLANQPRDIYGNKRVILASPVYVALAG